MVALFVQTVAGQALRGLYADGAYFATRLAANPNFGDRFTLNPAPDDDDEDSAQEVTANVIVGLARPPTEEE